MDAARPRGQVLAHRGKGLGIVGESGSGKTLTALAVMGLHKPPLRVTAGSVRLGKVDLLALTRRQLDRIPGVGSR